MGQLPLNPHPRRVRVRARVRPTASDWAAYAAEPEVIAWRQQSPSGSARALRLGGFGQFIGPPARPVSFVHLPLDPPLAEADLARGREDMARLAAGESVVF